MFGLPTAIVTVPIIAMGRRRVDWRFWECSGLVLPFACWGVLMDLAVADLPKSLANVAEPLYFAPAVPIAAMIRILLGRRFPQPVVAGILIALACAAAIAMYFLCPPLPEVPDCGDLHPQT